MKTFAPLVALLISGSAFAAPLVQTPAPFNAASPPCIGCTTQNAGAFTTLTATTLNKVTVTQPATAAALTILNNKTFTVNNTITLAGTDAQTYTLPTTSASIARTDAAQTFAGTQTFSGQILSSSTTTDFVSYAIGNDLTTGYGFRASGEPAIYSSGSEKVLFTNGNQVVDGLAGGVGSSNGGFLFLGAGTADVFLTRRAAGNWNLGKLDVGAPVAQTLSVQSVSNATANTAAPNFTINAPAGTGSTGTGGSFIVNVAPVDTSHATTAASGTGTTVTVTFSGGKTYPVGGTITVAGVTPSGYNQVAATVTASSAGSVSYANATTGAQTVAGTVIGVGTQNDEAAALTIDSTKLATFVGQVTVGGALNASNAILGNSDVRAGQSNFFYWTSRAGLLSPGDGIIKLVNNAGTDFLRLQFGGSTSSFCAIKSGSAAIMAMRRADDSGDCPVTGSTFTASSSFNFTNVLFSATAPTISSGFGTGATVPANNGTAVFTINVGTGGIASTGVLTMPAAAAGWACHVNNLTSISATVTLTKVTATTTTSVTIGNYTDVSAAGPWNASDVLQLQCAAY